MLVLGSNSKARYDLLKAYTSEIEVVTSNINEQFSNDLDVYKNVEKIALDKANDILKNNDLSNKILICADTIVLSNNQILCKPKDKKEAIKMIKSYSNNEVEVVTGVCIYFDNDLKHSFNEKSYVIFNEISDDMIEEYLSNNDYLNVAGALCIESIEKYISYQIKGSMSNIIGLPMEKISYLLSDHKSFDYMNIDKDIIDSCNIYRSTNRCYLTKDNLVYLLKCKTLNQKHIYYCSIGGGYHIYEDKIEALRREVLEETGYSISNIKYIVSNYIKEKRYKLYDINKLTINNYYVANIQSFSQTNLIGYEKDVILGIEGFEIDEALEILEKQITLFNIIEPEFKQSITDYDGLKYYKEEVL